MKITTSDAARISLCTALLVICSWISIPFGIPITLQIFAVVLLSVVLGTKKGLLCLLIYFLLGSFGLPVFSGFRGGISSILSPTGGYIFGFLPFCAIVGTLCKNSKATGRMIFSAILGLLILYASGTLWYSCFFAQGGIGAILSVCVFPFIIPDILKIILAALCARHLTFYL